MAKPPLPAPLVHLTVPSNRKLHMEKASVSRIFYLIHSSSSILLILKLKHTHFTCLESKCEFKTQNFILHYYFPNSSVRFALLII